MDQKTYRIEEVALKTELTKRALRYYEDLELVTPVRTPGGYRIYSEEDVETILRIKEIKESLGFCLSDIKEMLQLEQDYKDIVNGRITDQPTIEKSLTKIQRQMELVTQKEMTLERFKSKCQNAFDKLNSILAEYKGESTHEKD